MRFLAIPLISAAMLAGCAVGPDYHAPKTPATAAAPFIGTGQTPQVSEAAPAGDWWRLYQDPVLDGLVADALAANTDVRVAVARIERARASLRGARSERLPSTDIDASAAYARLPVSQVLPGGQRQGRSEDIGLSVGYEVDLFGRVARGIEASRADLGAAEADADAVRVIAVADTVRAYVDAANAAERLAVARRTVDLLDRSVRITGTRESRGLSDRLDLIRVTQLRDQQTAAIPAIEAARDAALFRLALLTGRTPAELPEAAKARVTTPDVAQPIPVGDGRALLARRPDVRAAERRLAADTARIGVATADLYPRITLGGSGGVSAVGAMSLFAGGPLNWLVSSMLSWSFPNQEAIRARIGESRADSHGDLAKFDGVVLTALQETETALSAYRNAVIRKQQLVLARDAATRAAAASEARQRVGRIDFLTVLDAQRTLAGAEADLADSTRSVAMAQVDLFRALGGGWQQPGPALATARP